MTFSENNTDSTMMTEKKPEKVDSDNSSPPEAPQGEIVKEEHKMTPPFKFPSRNRRGIGVSSNMNSSQ